jgi:hypothetical protein
VLDWSRAVNGVNLESGADVGQAGPAESEGLWMVLLPEGVFGAKVKGA